MATILIVDDLPSNRKYLVTLLGYHGHRLIEAADGSAALAAVDAERPDLVITDVLMPVMDGYELVRRLRLDPEKAGIPVVFYTAHYAEREARALALSSGVPYVLTKPAESAQVLRVVNLVLAGASERETPPAAAPVATEVERVHVHLVTGTYSEQGLRIANARLRALIDIGLELASERNSDRLLQKVCVAARNLFGATYVTLGIVDVDDGTVQRVFTCGVDAAGWLKAGDVVSGILRTVVTERRVLRGHNPDGTPAGLQLPPLHQDVQSFLAAPIASPTHVYGWICVVGNEGRLFTEEDEHLVLALMGQVARMYETGYLNAVAAKRAEEREQEILERKQAELALRHERDRAQRYLDGAGSILLTLDLECRITMVNRYACSMLGWTADELLGRDWIETCLPARIREQFKPTFDGLLRGDLSIVENPVLTRSGEERLVEWRNTPLCDDAGEVIGTFSSGTDITERNRAAETLRVAEERMRFALEAAGIGIWDMDYLTGMLRWSETLEAQYGLAPGTFGGSVADFIKRVHPDDRQALLETLGDARKGADFSMLSRSIRPDGTVRWLSGSGRVHLGESGEPVRAVGISMDVTERRRLEEQYQQAQKMEAVGRLAGGVAHDFNNLLTAILGYCELLLADFDPDDMRQTDILEIQKAGASAAGLTRQLLAFSRKQIIELTLLDLNVVVADLRSMLGRVIGEKVKVVIGLQPGLACVTADRSQMDQIVMNLAVNARDAMPKGGTLTIETATVELDEHYATRHVGVTPGFYVALTVTDTGTGMTPEIQARLFEPFFTTKEPGKGTGLGLATVHGIVTRYGGSVTVYSEVGRGTAFTIYLPGADAAAYLPAADTAAYLPVVDAAAAVDLPPPVTHPRAAAETVLVVEDAEGLRALTRRLLERQGYTVLVAANAEEALQIVKRHPSIELILTDVVMPGASGPELITQLADRWPPLKVVYMSGYTNEAIVQHGVLQPGIAFLHKPFTSEALGRKLREVLDR